MAGGGVCSNAPAAIRRAAALPRRPPRRPPRRSSWRLRDHIFAEGLVAVAGVEVIGPTDHRICQSIYFFDPNGHRLELTYDTTTREMAAKLSDAAEPMLEEWRSSKKIRARTGSGDLERRDAAS